jgi:hypothetical protein
MIITKKGKKNIMKRLKKKPLDVNLIFLSVIK